MESTKNSLSNADVKRWIRNTFIFSIPTLLALLTGLQSLITGDTFFPTKEQWIFVIGSAYQALLASSIDLIIKYKADNTK